MNSAGTDVGSKPTEGAEAMSLALVLMDFQHAVVHTDLQIMITEKRHTHTHTHTHTPSFPAPSSKRNLDVVKQCLEFTHSV